MLARIIENKKTSVPIITQVLLFFINLYIGSAYPHTWGQGDIEVFNMTVVTAVITFIIMVIGFDKASFWFYGFIFYYFLTIIGIQLNWFHVNARSHHLVVFSFYVWPFAILFYQIAIWCILKFLKWVYQKLKSNQSSNNITKSDDDNLYN